LSRGIITASCSEKSAPDRENDANTSEAPREPVRVSEVETAEGEAGAHSHLLEQFAIVSISLPQGGIDEVE